MEIKFSHSTYKKSGVRTFTFEYIIDEGHSIYFSTINGDYIKLQFYENVSELAHLCLEIILKKEFIKEEIKKEIKIKRLKK